MLLRIIGARAPPIGHPRWGYCKGAAKAAGRSVKYYTFRSGEDRAGRLWRAKDGRTLEYAEVRDAVREQAQTHGYTYRLMISTKESPLTMDDYRDVLNVLGDRWLDYYFVEHRNTEHPHAHVLAWRKTAMSGTEAKQMRSRLEEIEYERDREREQAAEQIRAAEQTRQQVSDRDRGSNLDR